MRSTCVDGIAIVSCEMQPTILLIYPFEWISLVLRIRMWAWKIFSHWKLHSGNSICSEMKGIFLSRHHWRWLQSKFFASASFLLLDSFLFNPQPVEDGIFFSTIYRPGISVDFPQFPCPEHCNCIDGFVMWKKQDRSRPNASLERTPIVSWLKAEDWILQECYWATFATLAILQKCFIKAIFDVNRITATSDRRKWMTESFRREKYGARESSMGFPNQPMETSTNRKLRERTNCDSYPLLRH